MPDLLAHVFLAYSLATVASWRYEWLTSSYVTVSMAGAFIPDLTKAYLVFPNSRVELTLGIPFDWFALHTIGGVICSILIGVLIVHTRVRRRVFLLLSLGAGSHLLADALLKKPTGQAEPMLWPFTRLHPPTPGLYLSTDVEPVVLLGAVALLVAVVTKYRQSTAEP
ncbi:metal-dependent hydrolase [Haloferax larsenii]|uniref:Metal-dependent hydrolase n=1 Tax=Haloferax larsenii TaxID=302484 RepID=A0ABY5RGR8_HALLR|nr:metal-dependent hydrolase [Haloferax larsenii]UVE50745.1 metal-dependent hydrolase [Haloferax larsenii]